MRTKTGIISSAKMTGTVTVIVHRSIFHPIYKKRYKVSKKFMADSKGYDLAIGDTVEITECRPISKNKHFRVTEVLKSVPRVSELKEEAGLEAVMNRKKESPEPKEKKKSASSDSSK